MLTISPSVCCRSPWVMGTLWNLSDVRRPYCSNSSIWLCSILLILQTWKRIIQGTFQSHFDKI
jgi:hypothetical protein